MTKIVLPQKFYKILRRRQIVPVGPRNWTKEVSRITYNTGRDQRVPFSVFFRHCETFFSISFHKRVSNSPILWHFEVLLLFMRLRYGADLGRSRLVFSWNLLKSYLTGQRLKLSAKNDWCLILHANCEYFNPRSFETAVAIREQLCDQNFLKIILHRVTSEPYVFSSLKHLNKFKKLLKNCTESSSFAQQKFQMLISKSVWHFLILALFPKLRRRSYFLIFELCGQKSFLRVYSFLNKDLGKDCRKTRMID